MADVPEPIQPAKQDGEPEQRLKDKSEDMAAAQSVMRDGEPLTCPHPSQTDTVTPPSKQEEQPRTEQGTTPCKGPRVLQSLTS